MRQTIGGIICPKCGHEFIYDSGEIHFAGDSFGDVCNGCKHYNKIKDKCKANLFVRLNLTGVCSGYEQT